MMRRITISLFFIGIFFFSGGIFREVRAGFLGATSTKEAACAIKLDWTYTGGNTGELFAIQRTTSTNWVSNIVILSNIPSYIVGQDNYTYIDESNLKAVNTYKYRISTSGPWKVFDPTAGIPITSVTSPSVPNNFVATGTYRNERIDLSWSPVTTLSPQGGYEILRATSVDGITFSSDVVIENNLSSTTDAYNDIGNGALDPTLVYRYTIKSFEGGPNAGCAESVYSTPATVIVPSLSTGVQATYSFTNLNVDINWIKGFGSSVSDIEVWRLNEESGYDVKLNGTPSCSGNVCSFSDSFNLVSNNNYKYHVRSCNSESGFLGCSDFSDFSDIVTITDAPQGFEARVLYASSSNFDKGNVFLKWNNTFSSADADYIIERTDSRGVVSTTSVSHTAPTTILTSAPLNERYTYRIIGDFSGGNLSNPSLPQVVDFNIGKILRGQAWGAVSSSLSGVNDKIGIGWINFNSDNESNAAVNYSVQVGRESGLFSGVARGSVSGAGYGWLSFNQNDLIGCPDYPRNPNDPESEKISEKCSVKLIRNEMLNIDEVRGWARFIFDTEYANAKAWDGWVRLNSESIPVVGSKNFSPLAEEWIPKETHSLARVFPFFGNHDFSWFTNTFQSITKPFESFTALADSPVMIDYGVTFARISGGKTGTFSGKAWAGNIGGWINFDLRDVNQEEVVAADIVNRKPTVSNVHIEIDPKSNWYKEPQRQGSDSVWCLEDPYYVVKFDYSDPDNDPIASANIQFIKDDGVVGAEFNNTTTTLGIVVSGTMASGTSRFEFVNPLGGATTENGYGYGTGIHLNPQTNYAVKVRAEDGYDFSDFALSSNTTTTPYYYQPLIDFTWDPIPASVQTRVNMKGSLLHRLGPTVPAPSGWQWTFPHASPGTAEGPTTTVTFSTASRPDDSVKLSVTQPGFGQSTTTICTLEKKDIANATTTTTINLRRRVFRER